MADSKSLEKRTARAEAREAFVEHKYDTDPAAEVMAARQAAKEAELAVGAIKTLQQIVPNWTRKERRSLANAIRLGGRGYTKP